MREAARFTLSELLLTIVIIMLLFSLAAAAAGSAQGSSKAAGCADNCRRMGMAFHTYANDFEGLLIFMNWTEKDGVIPWTRVVFKRPDDPRSLGYAEYGIGSCPDDENRTTDGIWVGMNGLYNYRRDAGYREKQRKTNRNGRDFPGELVYRMNDDDGFCYIRLFSSLKPGRTILYGDSYHKAHRAGAWYFTGDALQENGNIGFIRRHAGKGTVLMFDGHAEMRGRKSSQLKISFAEDGTPQDDREKP